jgi:hypothetical protein
MKSGLSPLMSVVILVVMARLAGAYGDSLVVRADLAFQFTCGGGERSVLEDDVVAFLHHEHFKVLNLGRIRREHNVIDVVDVQILAIDDARRTVDISSYPLRKNGYTLTLTTPPPTRHATQLEADLKTFVSESLTCQVSQVGEGNNEADAKGLYDWDVSRIENLFREAERLDGKQNL